MIKIFSKKFYTVLINVSAIGLGITMACGGGLWSEYGTSNFTPEAFVDSSYKPFFYSGVFYYEIGHDDTHDTRFNEVNIKDWLDFFGNKIPASEIDYLLTLASYETVDSVSSYFAGKLKSLPSTMQAFELLKNKSDKKTAEFLSYLLLAKQCETFSVNGLQHAWDYGPKKNKIQINFNQLKRELEQGFNNTNQPFLKQRYWFQGVRFYYFKSSPETSIQFFENNESRFPKNKLYYRSLAYAAGGYYKLKNYSRANYYYSKVYDGCPELKTVAHYSFHPQEERDWKATLSLCRSNDQRATLWQMLGIFYSDEKRAIREIHKLNRKSEKLDLLLTRAINKEEQKFSAWDDKLYINRTEPGKDSVNKSLLSLVTQITESGGTNKPYLWHMAAGYLNTLDKNYNKAKTHYSKAQSILPDEQLVQSQLRLLNVINTIGAAIRIDANVEKEILSDIKWLHEGAHLKLRYTDALEWIKQNIAAKYYNQKELVKAECFKSNSLFYASDKNVETMKSFLDKPGKTPYEQFCTELYIMQKTDLQEYQAIRLTLEDKITDAIVLMEKADPAVELPGNPFNGRIQDCHDCDHTAPQKIKYTKLSLLKKMKEMQDKITAGDDVYNNAILLAHACYNITHYGNARYFYESKVLGSTHYSPFAIDSVYKNVLTDMKLAVKYYSLALRFAQNDEQKAKCHHMLAKCERNQWYNENFYNNSESEYRRNIQADFKAWNGFKALEKYPNTQYHKEVIKECGYFRTYINK